MMENVYLWKLYVSEQGLKCAYIYVHVSEFAHL